MNGTSGAATIASCTDPFGSASFPEPLDRHPDDPGAADETTEPGDVLVQGDDHFGRSLKLTNPSDLRPSSIAVLRALISTRSRLDLPDPTTGISKASRTSSR